MKQTVASSLSTVSELLIDQLMSVTQEDISDAELEKRIKRADAVANLSSKIIEVNKTVIKAVAVESEYGRGGIPLIGTSED